MSPRSAAMASDWWSAVICIIFTLAIVALGVTAEWSKLRGAVTVRKLSTVSPDGSTHDRWYLRCKYSRGRSNPSIETTSMSTEFHTSYYSSEAEAKEDIEAFGQFIRHEHNVQYGSRGEQQATGSSIPLPSAFFDAEGRPTTETGHLLMALPPGERAIAMLQRPSNDAAAPGVLLNTTQPRKGQPPYVYECPYLSEGQRTAMGQPSKPGVSGRHRRQVRRMSGKRSAQAAAGKQQRTKQRKLLSRQEFVDTLQTRIDLRGRYIASLEATLKSGDFGSLIASFPEERVLPGLDNKCDLNAEGQSPGPPSDPQQPLQINLSRHQVGRLVHQARTICSLYHRLNERDAAHLLQLLAVTDANFNDASHFPRACGLPTDTAVKNATAQEMGLNPRTVSRWVTDYKATGCEGFSEDGRGKHQGNWILLQEDLKGKLRKWLLLQSLGGKLSVSAAHRFINEELLPRLGAEQLAEFGFSLPNCVCRRTAHNWMTRCGAKSTYYKKGYYNDMHERPDVVEYRDNVYTPMCEKVELREPLWVVITEGNLKELLSKLTTVSQTAITRVQDILLRKHIEVDLTGPESPLTKPASTKQPDCQAYTLSDAAATSRVSPYPPAAGALPRCCTAAHACSPTPQLHVEGSGPDILLASTTPAQCSYSQTPVSPSTPLVDPAPPASQPLDGMPTRLLGSSSPPASSSCTGAGAGAGSSGVGAGSSGTGAGGTCNIVPRLLNTLPAKALQAIVTDINNRIHDINETNPHKLSVCKKSGTKKVLVDAILNHVIYVGADYFHDNYKQQLEVATAMEAKRMQASWKLQHPPPLAQPVDDEVTFISDLAPRPVISEEDATVNMLSALIHRVDVAGETMFEYHVDLIQDTDLRERISPTGGNTSVRHSPVRLETCPNKAHYTNCKQVYTSVVFPPLFVRCALCCACTVPSSITVVISYMLQVPPTCLPPWAGRVLLQAERLVHPRVDSRRHSRTAQEK